jgi:hypothetical protein
MYINPFVTQQLAKERMKDAMRHNEQARLIRTVTGPGKPWRWQMSVLLTLKSLFVLVIRPHS